MSTTKQAISFSGQPIYVGLDVHKKSWQVSILLRDVAQKTFHLSPGEPEALNTYLLHHYPGGTYQCAYEAGFCGFWIQERLTQLGIPTQVYHASDIPTNDKEKRQKTDQRDSLKIAKALRQGDTDALFIPAKAQQHLRSLARQYAALVKDRQRVMHRIKGHLHFYGLQAPALEWRQEWSAKHVQWLKTIAQQDGALHWMLEQLISARTLEKGLLKQARHVLGQAPYKNSLSLLLSVPGIGFKSAFVLLTEIGLDWKRFARLEALCAYCGLMPDTNSSGDTIRVGDLTRRGNSRLRKLLIEAAWVAIRHETDLAALYTTYKTRMVGQKAIVKIARKLLNRIRHVMIHQERYTRA